jgi:zinc/manganese transport system permease protein
VLFLSVYTHTATATVNVLFGSILAVTRSNVWITLITGILVLLVLSVIFRPLLFVSIDPDVAETRGVPIKLLSLVFLVLLAITIAVAVQVVGVLLIFALLIAPAAAAERVTHRPMASIALSIVLALVSVWLGLVLGFVGTGRHLPVSFYISTLAALFYFLAVGISKLHAHIS